MSSWRERLRALAAELSIIGQQSPAGGTDDDDDDDYPLPEVDPPPGADESRRIVEEAIRRLEEAEHEWSRSWEPDKPAD